jgi:hypothetical protein
MMVYNDATEASTTGNILIFYGPWPPHHLARPSLDAQLPRRLALAHFRHPPGSVRDATQFGLLIPLLCKNL